MTVLDAIINLEKERDSLCDILRSTREITIPTLFKDRIEALGIAVILLEKEIPMKPKVEPFYGGRCIVCNGLIPNKSQKYCSNCGQAIDWGETDENRT